MCTCRPFYLFNARTVTACLVCCGLALSPAGAKTPPASVVGHILTAASSTGTLNAPMYATINSVTGNLPSAADRIAEAVAARARSVTQ
jgi:hypothetical protein